jgi:alkylation response protein AidB-like acyl-CoA dehydrogenase
MNFAFGEEQDLLRQSTRRFLDDRQSLAARQARLEDTEVFDRADWRAAAELGWTSMLIPPDYGGGSVTDQPIVDLIVFGEELGRVLHSGPFVPTNVVADAIATWGSGAQCQEMLPPIARGEAIAAWCLSGNGSNEPDECGVMATERSSAVVLNGSSRFVHGAGVADLLLVLARSGAGLVHFLVPASAPGVGVRTQNSIDLTRRFGEVTFEGVTVAPSQALGRNADEVLARAVDLATILQASEAVGAADRLFGQTVDYLNVRMQFGRRISSFQAIKHRLANLLIMLEGMRAATHYAALAVSDRFDDRRAAVSTAGAYVGDSFAALCGDALQLHGGIGFTWEHQIHLFIRRAVTNKGLYGDPSWHRERLCALAEMV